MAQVFRNPGESHEEMSLLRVWALLAATCFLAVSPFVLWGYSSSHDFDSHLSSWLEVCSQWRQGVLFPQWLASANHGFGEPKLVFYPPLSVYLGALLCWLLPVRVAPGAYVWLVLLLAGLCMFRLAREYSPRPWALCAGLLYLANPYLLLDVYRRFAAAESLVVAILPLIVLGVLRVDRGERFATLYLVLGVATASLTDIPAALIADYSVGLLALLLSLRSRSLRPLVQITIAGLLGTMLCSFYLVPGLAEAGWIQLGAFLHLIRPESNFLFNSRPGNLFDWALWEVAAGEIFLMLFAFRRWKQLIRVPSALRLAIAVLSCVGILLMVPVSRPFWRTLPKFDYIQFPWRWLIVVSFGVAVTTAELLRVGDRTTRIFGTLATLLVVGCVVAYTAFGYFVPGPFQFARIEAAVNQGEEPSDFLPTHAVPVVETDRTPKARLVTDLPSQPGDIALKLWEATRKVIEVATPRPAVVGLRLFFYPRWLVYVNGKPTELRQDGRGAIVVPVPAGQSRIEVVFGPAPSRNLALTLTLAAICLLPAVLRLESKLVPVTPQAGTIVCDDL